MIFEVATARIISEEFTLGSPGGALIQVQHFIIIFLNYCLLVQLYLGTAVPKYRVLPVVKFYLASMHRRVSAILAG